MQLFLPIIQENWTSVSDANELCYSIFQRHYTFKERISSKNKKRFVGPGERIILLSKEGNALFVWRKERYRRDNQIGANCAIFRNESKLLSSELIKEADEIAWNRWPGIRLYTFVNPVKIKSSNPGYCFKMAGYKECGITKVNKLIILEKLPIFP